MIFHMEALDDSVIRKINRNKTLDHFAMSFGASDLSKFHVDNVGCLLDADVQSSGGEIRISYDQGAFLLLIYWLQFNSW